MAAEETLALLAMHQGGTLEQQGRRQDVAGDGGEDVDGGAHSWRLGGAEATAVGCCWEYDRTLVLVCETQGCGSWIYLGTSSSGSGYSSGSTNNSNSRNTQQQQQQQQQE